MDNSIITLTFGDCAENHVGMQKLGEIIREGEGYTIKELEKLNKKFDKSEIVYMEMKDEKACVLIIRDGVNIIGGENMTKKIFNEQKSLDVDKKVKMYGRVVNKLARWNLCFDNKEQEPDYDIGKGRVICWNNVPNTKLLREKIEINFGEKSKNLKCEGNYYYDIKKCGIGYHGDTERRKVIGIRLGKYDIPLHYQWYYNSKPVGDNIKIEIKSGDIYIMSEKAVGTDWKKKKIYTLRHATGAPKYTNIKY